MEREEIASMVWGASHEGEQEGERREVKERWNRDRD